MQKKVWANAVWMLFHTLAEKIKPEHAPSEIAILFEHFTSICNNLPCPDCQAHAMQIMTRVNKSVVCASRESLIHFMWQFHNNVNARLKLPQFPRAALDDRYKKSSTPAVVRNFMRIMSATTNNEKTMMHAFHRHLYLKRFTEYIRGNSQKYAI